MFSKLMDFAFDHSGRLWAGLLLVLATVIGMQSLQVRSLRSELALTITDAATAKAQRDSYQVTLTELAVKHQQAKSELEDALKKAARIRTVTQSRTNKVLVETWPQDCRAAALKARDYVQDVLREAEQ